MIKPVLWNKFLSALCRASLVAQTVKNLPAIQETQIGSLGQENPLEKGVATHSSILAWRTLWTEEPQATVHGVTKSQTGLSTHTHTQGELGEAAWPEGLTFRANSDTATVLQARGD